MSQVGSRFGLSAAPGRVRVLFEGHEVADSAKALALTEAGRKPVYYFPREDVQMSVLKANDHVTSNPDFGRATWFTIMRDAKIVEDVAWSYEKPIGEAELVKGYVSFRPEHVEFEFDGQDEPAPRVPPMDPPYAE